MLLGNHSNLHNLKRYGHHDNAKKTWHLIVLAPDERSNRTLQIGGAQAQVEAAHRVCTAPAIG